MESLVDFIKWLYNIDNRVKYASPFIFGGLLAFIYYIFYPFELNSQSLVDTYSQTLSVIIRAIAGILAILGIFVVFLVGKEGYPKKTILNDSIIYAGFLVIFSLIILSLKDIIFLYIPLLGVFLLFFVVCVTIWVLINFLYFFVTLPERFP